MAEWLSAANQFWLGLLILWILGHSGFAIAILFRPAIVNGTHMFVCAWLL